MKASIIIASNGRRAITQRTIRTALAQNFTSGEYELILVLDGCDEPDWCAAEQLNARCHFQVMRQPKRGQAASINAGLRIAMGELVLFLDDDILCPPDLLAKHVEAHDSHPDHLAFGPIFTSEESSASLATEWIRNRNDSWFRQVTPDISTSGWCFCFANPNTSAPRRLLLSAGALDESFWRYNDTEFGFRLWKQGLRFVYLPDAPVSHVVVESISDLVRKHAYEEGRGEVRLCRKHPEYRQFTILGGLSHGRTLKIVARRITVAACKLAEVVLAPASLVANIFRGVPFARRAGLRIISWRFIAHFFRGALAECGSWKSFHREFALRLPVLAYHRVGQAEPGEWYALTISKRRLESHLRWLKRNGWNSITSAQWSAWLESGAPLPHKPILLTFDDGFAENTINALPLLKQYGFVALTSVVTNQLGRTNNWDSNSGLPEFQLMNADDIRTWNACDMEFASHSLSHPHLPDLPKTELAREVALSRTNLAALAGVDICSFVYPYGEYNDQVCENVSHHYKLAFSLDAGLNGIGDAPHRLRRNIISQDDTWLDLWFHTKLGWSPVAVARRSLRTAALRLRNAARQVRTTRPSTLTGRP
ncbi:MAG: hypothetical protein CXZ00_15080 [Acidobacteria bacterium]|nr:MAG: hypothetical protein CXZ00_15080 [Acidobacteriota bacterium]